MLIPYAVIPEILGGLKPKALGKVPAEGHFNWVEALSGDDGFESKQTIYVAAAEDAVRVGVPEGYLCVCTGAGRPAPPKPYGDGGILFLKHCGQPRDAVRILREAIMRLQAWEREMDGCILGHTLGKLLSCGSREIGNPVFLYNHDYHLLGYAGNLEKNDPLYEHYVEGRTKESEFDAFVNRLVATNGRKPAHLSMIACNRPATDGCVALFDVLAEKVALYIERESPPAPYRHTAEAFLVDLIEERITNPIAVANRAEFCDVPVEKLYCLYVAQFREHNDVRMMQALKSFAEALPHSVVVPFNDTILILNYYMDEASFEQNHAWVDALRDPVRFYGAELGVSTPELLIGNLRLAYKRAVLAIAYGKRVRKKRGIDYFDKSDINRYADEDIYLYESYYIYHIIDSISEDNKMILESSFCVQALAKLNAYDKANNIDNVRLLYCYLLNERSATKTAAALHMHRNNVIYRINRIEQMLGVSLNEHHFRFKFMLAYRILDFYGLEYLEKIDVAPVACVSSGNFDTLKGGAASA